ncbi:Hypothetical predicted protein [Podarcis lilfordi]|uniref:Uncharacterized protein n=1 Tax=Podarcis lilfordi TaxID=74358 RepID=A0AA35JNC7_9SAUR|nr:Hypothetical predicted protein [Podarcis lilfordi]
MQSAAPSCQCGFPEALPKTNDRGRVGFKHGSNFWQDSALNSSTFGAESVEPSLGSFSTTDSSRRFAFCIMQAAERAAPLGEENKSYASTQWVHVHSGKLSVDGRYFLNYP